MKLSFIDSLRKLGYIIYADSNPIIVTRADWGGWCYRLDSETPNDVALEQLHNKSNEMITYKLAMVFLRQANTKGL